MHETSLEILSWIVYKHDYDLHVYLINLHFFLLLESILHVRIHAQA